MEKPSNSQSNAITNNGTKKQNRLSQKLGKTIKRLSHSKKNDKGDSTRPRRNSIEVSPRIALRMANNAIEGIPLKVIIAGETEVGKTSLLRKFVDNQFIETYESTIGIDFKRRVLIANGDTRFKLQLWDFAGNEKFRTSITDTLARGSHIFMICIDLSKENSEQSVETWLKFIEHDQNVVKYLIGCKSDLKRAADPLYLKNFGKTHGLDFVATSSKNGDNVEYAFNTAVRKWASLNMAQQQNAT